MNQAIKPLRGGLTDVETRAEDIARAINEFGNYTRQIRDLVLAGQYRPPLRIEPTALGERGGALGAALLARRVADAAS